LLSLVGRKGKRTSANDFWILEHPIFSVQIPLTSSFSCFHTPSLQSAAFAGPSLLSIHNFSIVITFCLIGSNRMHSFLLKHRCTLLIVASENTTLQENRICFECGVCVCLHRFCQYHSSQDKQYEPLSMI